MTTGLLRHAISTLRLRVDAPWPSQQAAGRLESIAMREAADPANSCPVSAPSAGQIVAFPVAACRNLSKRINGPDGEIGRHKGLKIPSNAEKDQ
jgi:hypothetical protein